MLRLRLFGGVAIARNGVPVTETAELHKALALLALVAASGERGMSRDQLAAFLWPESDSEHARAALSQTLYTLRKQLAEPELLIGTRTLRLNPTAIGSDLGDFEQALERDDPEAAVGLYSGVFLNGFFIPNCLELERWIDAERADLVQRWAAAIESLARRATERGDHASAVRWWRRMTATEPGNSRAAAALVEALAAVGDRAGALNASRSHEEFLRSEFDAPPDPAVSALAEKIRRSGGTMEVATGRDAPSRSDPEPSVPRQPNATLVGRRAVMASARVVRVATMLGLVVILAIWRLSASAATEKVNAEAHDHLVRGNSYLALRTLRADTRAILEYQDAVHLDPRFARAYGRMAFAYFVCSQNEEKCFGLGRDSLIARGFAAADSALKIDSMTSDAWLALASLRAENDPRNLEGAREAIDRAVALDPTNAEAHHVKAFIYRYWSDSIALAEYNKALEIEPLRPATLLQLGHTTFLLGRYRSALTLMDSVIKLALQPHPIHFLVRGDLRRRLGDTAGARSDADTILRFFSTDDNVSMARLLLGRIQSPHDGGLEYRRLVEKMAHDFSGRTGNLDRGAAVSLAIDLLALGENERAMEFLERVEPSAAFWYSLKGDGLDPIRSEPRFQELCRRTRPRRANGGCG